MKPNDQQPSEPPPESKPNPEFIAQQLRRPSGDFAPEVGQKMNQVNKPLYDLSFDVKEMQKGDKILEIGFGNGRFFEQLFSKESELQVSGIDFSEAMVEEAKEYNQDRISSGKLEIGSGSSEAIPFADQTFDKVFCNMVIYFWDQPSKHLKEIQRVLKPGGTFFTGMRTRESMLVFPFVKYGFNLCSIKEWEGLRWSFFHRMFKNGDKPFAELTVDGAWLNLDARKLGTPADNLIEVMKQFPRTEDFEWTLNR